MQFSASESGLLGQKKAAAADFLFIRETTHSPCNLLRVYPSRSRAPFHALLFFRAARSVMASQYRRAPYTFTLQPFWPEIPSVNPRLAAALQLQIAATQKPRQDRDNFTLKPYWPATPSVNNRLATALHFQLKASQLNQPSTFTLNPISPAVPSTNNRLAAALLWELIASQ